MSVSEAPMKKSVRIFKSNFQILDPVQANASFLYSMPLKTSKNVWFFVLQGYKMGPLAQMG